MLNRRSQQIALGLLLTAAAAVAQPPLAFEVATIKPSAPLDPAALRSGRAHIGTRIDSSTVDIGTASLFRLICNAYQLRPYQVSGPDWLKEANFDIQARIPAGVSPDKVPQMLQSLLVERFGLKLHHESKDQSVYALIVAPGGPRLKEAVPETPPPPPPPNAPAPPEMMFPTLQGDLKITKDAKGLVVEMPGQEILGKIRLTQPEKGAPQQSIHLESPGTTMKSFAAMLSVGVVNRPVVDMTNLTGTYDIGVDLSMEDAVNAARASVTFMQVRDAPPGAGLADPSGSSIRTSIEKLGLKLDPRKLPLDLLVVDHIEKLPTAN